MVNNQDEKNIGKIKESINDIISQSAGELEKDVAVLLQKQKNTGKKIAEDIENKAVEDMFDDQPKKGIPMQLYDNTPYNKEKKIGQTSPTDNENRPDTIYGNRENRRSQDMSGDHEKALKENVDRDHESALQENVDRDHEEALKENKSREKGKYEKTTAEAPKTEETPETKKPGPPEGITPGTKDQSPLGRADEAQNDETTIGGQTTPEKKETPEKNQQQRQRNRDLSREQRLARIKQHKEKKAQKKKEEAKKTEEKAEANIGKMSPLAFIIWIFLAIMADIGSLIPYLGLLVSWPFAGAFGLFKWQIKIKKELAITTTVLDFLFEGLLSTLPVNTLDVIMTFVISNSSTARTITKKISKTMPIKK